MPTKELNQKYETQIIQYIDSLLFIDESLINLLKRLKKYQNLPNKNKAYINGYINSRIKESI